MHRHFSGNKEYKFLLAIKKKKSTEDYRFRGSSLPWNFF